MFGLYSPLLILQAFCIYHAYRNRAQYMWYWVIILLPVVGCIIYLFNNFYSRDNVRGLAEGVKEIVITNYRLEQLEKELRFSDTITNRINLADAYVENQRFSDAIHLYRECQTGFMADDPVLEMKLMRSFYLNGEMANVVECGKRLESEKSFRSAEERVAYAWALHETGEPARAVAIFEELDKPFTNYFHRKEYCKYLIAAGQKQDARAKLETMLAETDHMTADERRFKKEIIRDVKTLLVSTASA